MKSRRIRKEGKVFAKQALLNIEMDCIDVKGKVVFEIGAGDGRLTEHIATGKNKAKKVIAIEKDKRLCMFLNSRFKDCKNVEIVCADIRKFKIPKVDVVIGNIPYSLSSYIVFKLMKETEFKVALLTVQKEFAQRLMARPGSRNYSRLSVVAQAHFDVRYIKTIKPSMFTVRPKVDSAIITLWKKTDNYLPKGFDDVVRLLFQRKRKTLRKGIIETASELGIDESCVDNMFETDLLKERIFNLSIERLEEITEVVNAWRYSSNGAIARRKS